MTKIPKAKGDKRVLIIADTHCGHLAGLTPPEYQYEFLDTSKTKRNDYAKQQKDLWQFYADIVNSLRPIDILILNGDMIDGKGDRSGGTELISSDRAEQVNMAMQVIEFVEAGSIVMTYGTPYHVGKDEDWEAVLADKVGAKIGSHEWIDVNGLVFDVKHKIGSSTIPHGRYTALARDALWNDLWAKRGGQPQADIIVRSHVHYHVYCGERKRLALITPALQGHGSKYGSRICSGTVDTGIVYFDVDKEGGYAWECIDAVLESQIATAQKL